MFRNTGIPMTRRYPQLKDKVLRRDSKIVKQIIEAWDVLHSAPLVLKIFQREHAHLSDERYWEILKAVWIIAGSTDLVHGENFFHYFLSDRPAKYYFMTPEEAARKRALPETITVYRACNSEDDGGISWTLSEEYALQFQKAFNKKMIRKETVSSDRVWFLIERNAEEELIIMGL